LPPFQRVIFWTFTTVLSGALNAQCNTHQRFGFKAQPNGHGSVRGKMTTDKRSMMLTRIGSTISASEGTLAGDILWLATIAFIFSVVIGIVG
jgi:hypothetical protein